ncbi:TPA: hypothetical protein ACGB4L_001478 [Serratia marcescens]
MDNKLSELSKPVATVDVQRGRMDGNTFAVAWSSAGHALPDGPHFIYSQEYVSALQHESAVNWEAAASLNVENQELKKRIAELEQAMRHIHGAALDITVPRVAIAKAAELAVEHAAMKEQSNG